MEGVADIKRRVEGKKGKLIERDGDGENGGAIEIAFGTVPNAPHASTPGGLMVGRDKIGRGKLFRQQQRLVVGATNRFVVKKPWDFGRHRLLSKDMVNVLAIIIVALVAAFIGIIVGVWWINRGKKTSSGEFLITEGFNQIEERLRERFKAAAGEALQANQKLLLEQVLEQSKLVMENARNVSTNELQKQGLELQKSLAPLQTTLQKLELELIAIEKVRAGAYAGIGEQIKEMNSAQKELRAQTGNLVQALRAPQARGAWGEMQLKRVVEFAGMTAYVDFAEQVSTTTEEGRLRPDMTIRLPGGRTIVVDSKVPMEAYIRATLEENPDEKRLAMKDHARQLKDHFKKLGQKKYFEQFAPSPEFVVLFLNTESSLGAALEVEPQLIEEAISERVLVATPTSLIALLKAASYGWGEAQANEKAREILEFGKDLFNRLRIVNEAWADVGKNLSRSVESYNTAAASVENRLLVSARRIANKVDWELPPVDAKPTR